MKLSNNNIYGLMSAGFGHLYYANLPYSDAFSCFLLRKQIVALYADVDETKNNLLNSENDKATIKDKLDEYGLLEKDVEIKQPITFKSWLQLLHDNPWLVGFEEALAEFIQA